MTPFLLRKRISRALRVTSRSELTRHDIEALQANVRRVGLVIQLRWALVAVLAIYSVIAGLLYSGEIPLTELVHLMVIPGAALAFVVVYNTFFQMTYKRLGNLAIFNNVQLALDVMVVVLLVYYSGGIASWFWSVISLFILESAFIRQRPLDTWGLAIFGSALLGAVFAAEYFGLIPHQVIPFYNGMAGENRTYVAVRYLWQVTVLFGTASVAIIGTRAMASPAESGEAVIDPVTGLYSRSFFRRSLTAELGRARREHRPAHLLLIDIDRFADFNRHFGIDRGDQMLEQVAKTIRKTMVRVGDNDASTNVAARYGGEEFAVLLVEDLSTDSVPDIATARRLAEDLRSALGAVRVDDAGVTVSVGVATFPLDGSSPEDLLEAADEALIEAVEAGGDRVSVAAQPTVATGA